MSVHARRRLIALAVLLVAAAGVIPLISGGAERALPEAGSSFREEPRARERGSSLISALAPLLSAGTPSSEPSASTTKTGVSGSEREDQDGSARAGSNPRPRLAREAARLFVVGFAGTRPSAEFFERLRVREWGGVLVTGRNYVDTAQLAALTGEVGVVARNAGHRVPLVATRQAGGDDSAFADLPPKHPLELGSAADVRRAAAEAGRRLRELGITMNLAPDADLGAAGGPWEGRAFDAEPGPVGTKVREAVAGYRSARVAAVVGHFPGEGAASDDPALNAATVGLGLDELRERDVRPFKAVARTAPAVQMSGALYAAWDGVTPATLLPDAVALLRATGFRGVVVSADLGAASFVSGTTPGDAAVDALNAGCDLLLLPGDMQDQEQALRTVVRAIRRGTVSASRVRQALARADALRKTYGVGSAR